MNAITARFFALLTALVLAACGSDGGTENGAPNNDSTNNSANIDNPDTGDAGTQPDDGGGTAPDSGDGGTAEPDLGRDTDVPDADDSDGGDENDAGDDFDALAICDDNCAIQEPGIAERVDCDADGLANSEEAILGTDPCENDSDGDGLGDLQELQQGTEPTSGDTDSDGLDDFAEVEFRLDPGNPDTLGDGILDGDRWVVNVCRNDNPDRLEPTGVEEFEPSFGTWRIALPSQFTFDELVSTSADRTLSAGVFGGTASEIGGFAYTYDGSTLSSAPDLELSKVEFPVGSTILRQSVDGLISTWDREEAVRGRWQIRTSSPMSTLAVRDAILEETSPESWSNFPVSAGSTYTEFQVYVSVIHRTPTDLDQYVVLVAVAPLQAFESRDKVQFRMDDLTNTTGLAHAVDARETQCRAENLLGVRPQVDFYWVLDDSGSMTDYFNTMVNTAQDFFAQLQLTNLDYRIGVTSTDPGADGRIRPVPGWHTDQASFTGEIFAYVCPGGNCRGGSEYGLENAKLGIEYMYDSTTPQVVRFRPEAQVITIVMSDEDAQSVKDVGTFNSPAGQTLIDDYITFFTGVGIPLFAIYNDGTCPGIGDDGESYRQVANATGGASSLLCGTDLTATIEDIITAAAGRVGVVQLPYTPISASLNVFKNGEFVPRSRVNGWDYFPSSDSIAFFGDARPKVTQPGERGDDIAIGYARWEDRKK